MNRISSRIVELSFALFVWTAYFGILAAPFFHRGAHDENSYVPMSVSNDVATLVAGFGGAVLGSIVAGIITVVSTQLQDFNKERSLLLKLMAQTKKIVDTLHGLLAQFEQQVIEANKNPELVAAPLRTKILAAPEPITEIHIGLIEDALPLYAAKEFELLDNITDLESNYKNVRAAFLEYGKTRRIMGEKSNVSGRRGNLISGKLSFEQKQQLIPLEVVLDSLLDQLLVNLKDGILRSTEVALRVGPVSRSILQDRSFPVMKLVIDPKQVEIRIASLLQQVHPNVSAQ